MEGPPAKDLCGSLLQNVQRGGGFRLEQVRQPAAQALRGISSGKLQIEGLPVVFLIEAEDLTQLRGGITGGIALLLKEGDVLLIALHLLGELAEVVHGGPQSAVHQASIEDILVKFRDH